ncbi:MAG TPA: hypothetical protein VMR86_04755 [Myxococcota bacterium]|nr:hypothetical protein [Myxococcota bacterium]
MFRKNDRSGASAALALAALACLASAARAGETVELRPQIIVEQDYDSNIFSIPNSDPAAKGSPVTIVRPSLNLESTGTLGRWYLDGWLSSHTYWDESDLDGVDRGMSGGFDRTVLPRLSLFGDGSYMRIAPHAEIRAPSEVGFVTEPGTPTEPVISPGQLIEGAVPNADLAQGQFGGRYQLTPLDKLQLSGGPFSVDYLAHEIGRADLRDRDGWFTRLVLQHDLSYLDTISFELSANSTNVADAVLADVPVQDPFDPHTVGVNTGRDISNQQSFSIGWDRTWSELWTTHIEIGVRRLESLTKGAQRQVTRVGPPVGGSSDAFPFHDFLATDFDSVGPGVVGQILVRRALPRGRVQFAYQRETRTTSSLFSSDVDVDTVSLAYIHNLSQRATLSLTGLYEHYESVNDSPVAVGAQYIANSFNPVTGPSFSCPTGGRLTLFGSGANKAGQCQFNARSTLQSDAYYAEARLDWQLRKRLATFVTLRFTDRTGDVQLFGPPYNKFTVGVGFSWDYAFGH